MPSPPGPASTPSAVWERGRRTLTAGLVLVVMLVASEAMAVATVMPLIERDLGELWLYGWVFSAFFLGNLVGIVVAGRASDRMPVTVPFAAGLVLFAGGLFLGGLAPSMPVLVLARALQGLGAGALPAVAYVCIGRGYEPAMRPRMFALLSTAWVVPSLMAPAIAGAVGEHLGWRWVFLGLLPLVVVFGGLALVGVRSIPTPATQGEATSLLDAVLLAAGAAAVLAGLGTHSVVVALVLVGSGAAIGSRSFRRLVPPGTLRARPGLPAAVLSRGILTFSFFCADAFVPLALTSVRGLSVGVAGLVLALSSLCWAVGSWVQERRVQRNGPGELVFVGFMVVVGAASAFGLVLVPSVPVAVGFVGWGIGGLGAGLAYASVAVTVLGEAQPGREGAASAALQLTDTLGVALGTGCGGALVAAGAAAGWTDRLSLAPVFVLSAGVGVLGAVLARRLPARLPVQAGRSGSSAHGAANLDR